MAVFDLEWETGLAVRRELFVGRGFEEVATVWNRADREVEVVLELELASDFADIFAVKRVEDLGAPGTSEVAPSRPERWQDAGTVEFADLGVPGAHARASGPGARRRRRRRGAVQVATRARRTLAPRGRRAVATDETPELDAAAFEAGLRDDRRDRDASLAAWWSSAPRTAAHRPNPRSSARGRNRSRTWLHSGRAGPGAAWFRRRDCRGS